MIKYLCELDNSKLGSTQQQKICWHWHVARIISSQKIYGLYARKHHIVEMRGDVTDARRRTTTTEDRATQPMEAWGWVSQKVKQKQTMQLWIVLSNPFKFSYFPTAKQSGWWQIDAADVNMPSLRQAIWEDIWKRTLEKSQTIADNATLYHLV